MDAAPSATTRNGSRRSRATARTQCSSSRAERIACSACRRPSLTNHFRTGGTSSVPVLFDRTAALSTRACSRGAGPKKMNDFHNLRDNIEFAAAERPTKNPLSPFRSRAEMLGDVLPATLPASRQRTLQPACAQPSYRRTTDEFLINGPAIRIHRKPLKTNNRAGFLSQIIWQKWKPYESAHRLIHPPPPHFYDFAVLLSAHR